MPTLTVTRWTRYGQDRLYVSTGDGARVGWLDLQTQAVTVERSELEADLHAALAAHQGLASPAPAPILEPQTLEPCRHEPDWDDLTNNLPGQAVREQAELELAAMKDRTRVGTFLARALDMKTDERAWR